MYWVSGRAKKKTHASLAYFFIRRKGLAEIEIRDQGVVGRLIFSAQKVVFF